MSALAQLATPAILVDRPRTTANLRAMQEVCDRHAVELRPHLKTHKLVPLAREQLAFGAAGLTCAKLGEAEAILPSGVRHLFVAHSLVDPAQAPRVAALAEQLDDLRLAVTSLDQADAFARLAARTGRRLRVMLAVDTGLGREGVRDVASAQALAAAIGRSPHLDLAGFYSHEGHFYTIDHTAQATRAEEMITRLATTRDAIDPALPIWPGCSVTAHLVASTGRGRVQCVRPGAYVFGDLYLTTVTGALPRAAVALTVLATVVDKPEPDLALIDAGSKTFSSDRTPDGITALAADGRDLAVTRVNEEHGYLRGRDVATLRIGERVRLVPAHVCPVVNLTDRVTVVDGDQVLDEWPVDARGRTQ